MLEFDKTESNTLKSFSEITRVDYPETSVHTEQVELDRGNNFEETDQELEIYGNTGACTIPQ